MPAYPGPQGSKVALQPPQAPSIMPGDTVFAFGTATDANNRVSDQNVTAEAPVSGTASIAVCLSGAQMSSPPPMVTVELNFASTPGVAEVDIQEADTDGDAFYITPTNSAYTIVPTTTAPFITRVDLSPTGGKFLRLYVKTSPNTAKLIAKITRLA